MKKETQKRTELKKKSLLQYLEQTLGVVSVACKQASINRETHYRWLKEDEEYRKAVQDLDNVALDFAESKLHQQIKENNTSATIFYLKTKGKKRGYVEQQDINFDIPKREIKIVSG